MFQFLSTIHEKETIPISSLEESRYHVRKQCPFYTTMSESSSWVEPQRCF